jgi:hypothetical protein
MFRIVIVILIYHRHNVIVLRAYFLFFKLNLAYEITLRSVQPCMTAHLSVTLRIPAPFPVLLGG